MLRKRAGYGHTQNVKYAIEYLNKGDIEGMAKSWDDDISIGDMTNDSLVVRGKDHAIQMFKNQYKR